MDPLQQLANFEKDLFQKAVRIPMVRLGLPPPPKQAPLSALLNMTRKTRVLTPYRR